LKTSATATTVLNKNIACIYNTHNKRNTNSRMTSWGYSSISHANQILQPNIVGGANPSNAHFTNPGPQYSSVVGGVTGFAGAGGSAAALAGNPGYKIVATQSGGERRGGHYKRSQSKKRGCTCRGKCWCRRQNKKRSCRCRGRCQCRRRRTMRGGTISPAVFSGGANLPYQQYMGNVPLSNNFSSGSSTPLPLNLIGTANPVPITAFPNCKA